MHRHRNEHYEETVSSNKHHKRKRGSHHSDTYENRNKHRKHSEDLDRRSKHRLTSHRKRERHRNINENSRELENNEDYQRSKWNDNEDSDLYMTKPIKVEPTSDNEDTRWERVPNNGNVVKENEENNKWGKKEPVTVKEESSEPKQKINFGLSGKLTEDANTYNGIVIKYSQPPEARKPKRRWRWYIFKGDEELPFLPLHRQSAYLIGRERKIADIPTDHPSCSKQHAVFQYRLVSYERPDGTVGRTVKPYILDLESANGTYVNNRRIDPRRYVELFEKDVVKFGYSSREYVLLHEASKGSDDELPDAGTESADLSPVSMLLNQ